MTREQQDVTRVSDPAQARALKGNIELLGRFVSPASPSDVAGALGQPANLVHHHARRLTDLGLLFEARREGGKVYLQLAAREFRFPSNLLPPLDGQGRGEDVEALGRVFNRAYENSWSRMHQAEEDIVGFGDGQHPARPLPLPDSPAEESCPPHLDALTLRLTPERYRRLVRALSALLDEAAGEGVQQSGEVCTITLLASRGAPQHEPASFSGVSRNVSSFLGADPA